MINMHRATTWEPDKDGLEMWESEWPNDGMWRANHCTVCDCFLWSEEVHVSPNGMIMLCNECMEKM